MSSTTDVHPDLVVDAMIAAVNRSNVKRTLMALHNICSVHYKAGFRDFSIASIGRKAEDAGLFSSKILYNKSSQLYKDLIKVWAAYAGPPVSIPPKNFENYEYLKKIQDHAVRMIVQSLIAERNRYKTQLNMLKHETPGVVVTQGAQAGTMAVMLETELTQSERDALASAISRDFLVDQGWVEGTRGEIKVNKSLLFKPGFTTAIRKILGDSKPELKIVQ
jgi:hypothetical protein